MCLVISLVMVHSPDSFLKNVPFLVFLCVCACFLFVCVLFVCYGLGLLFFSFLLLSQVFVVVLVLRISS